jgi:hypothetical protein
MTRTHERAVAAMSAIGNTVTGAPPLRLPPPAATSSPRSPRSARSAARAWRLWLVPAAAAAAVVAIAVSLVLVRSAPKEPPATPGVTGPVASAAMGPNSVPPYYVSLPPAAFGWYVYAPSTPPSGKLLSTLVIGSTTTGKRLATVAAPDHLTFNVVTAASDDRTFVAGATSYAPGQKGVGNWSETWYLLRIAPGLVPVARLTKLPVPDIRGVTGVALSPDGTQLAVASQRLPGPSDTPPSGSPELTLWSTATGKALRSWGTSKGQITAATPIAASYPWDALDSVALATALRWTPDGRDLAFAWNGSAIRLLELASPTSQDSDLGQASTERAAIGPSYTGVGAIFTCDAADGWALSTGATTFTCAGSFTPADNEAVSTPGQTAPARPGNCPAATPAHLAFIQQIVQPGDTELTLVGESPTCTNASTRASAAILGWASADGSKVIGALQPGYEYGPPDGPHPQYGIFTEKTFVKLPPLPSTDALATVAW